MNSAVWLWPIWAKASLIAIMILFMLYGTVALFYQVHSLAWRYLLIVFWVTLFSKCLYSLYTSPSLLPVICLIIALGGFVFWWHSIKPSMQRHWADDVEHISYGHVKDNQLIVHHVRNFHWRSLDDYETRWEIRHYDLNQLDRVDMILSYWMGPAVAHTLVSFGFSDGRHLVFSVEIRKEKNEQFSSIGGFFKQFEMALIAADERDIVRTRSNVRGEDVFLYEIDMSSTARRSLLIEYLQMGNELQLKPRFYNTLTANCTTIVYALVSRVVKGLPIDYRLLLSGYLPSYLSKLDALAPGFTLEQLKASAHINQRARESLDGDSFSVRIREGVPRV